MDFSQVVVANYMQVSKNNADNTDVDLLPIVRGVTFDSIRKINKKFKKEYGPPIFAIDSVVGSWRKDIFPYYKIRRKELKDNSKIDWKGLIQSLNTVKEELKEYFPYKVIEVEKSEADDIIGVLSKYSVMRKENCMIVSGDHDFIQLQINNGYVKQWDKRLDKFLSVENPKRYLFEHVLKGDSGDSIPNILSPRDSIATKTRQKPMTQTRLDDFWDNPEKLRGNDRFLENIKLVDLSKTPIDIQKKILNTFEDYATEGKQQIMRQYFITNRMKRMFDSLNDF